MTKIKFKFRFYYLSQILFLFKEEIIKNLSSSFNFFNYYLSDIALN